jgi:hypothetical protein
VPGFPRPALGLHIDGAQVMVSDLARSAVALVRRTRPGGCLMLGLPCWHRALRPLRSLLAVCNSFSPEALDWSPGSTSCAAPAAPALGERVPAGDSELAQHFWGLFALG